MTTLPVKDELYVITDTPHGVKMALASLGMEVRHDTSRKRCQIQKNGEWKDLTDIWEAHLLSQIELSCGFLTPAKTDDGEDTIKPAKFALSRWRQHIRALQYLNQVDPTTPPPPSV